MPQIIQPGRPLTNFGMTDSTVLWPSIFQIWTNCGNVDQHWRCRLAALSLQLCSHLLEYRNYNNNVPTHWHAPALTHRHAPAPSLDRSESESSLCIRRPPFKGTAKHPVCWHSATDRQLLTVYHALNLQRHRATCYGLCNRYPTFPCFVSSNFFQFKTPSMSGRSSAS